MKRRLTLMLLIVSLASNYNLTHSADKSERECRASSSSASSSSSSSSTAPLYPALHQEREEEADEYDFAPSAPPLEKPSFEWSTCLKAALIPTVFSGVAGAIGAIAYHNNTLPENNLNILAGTAISVSAIGAISTIWGWIKSSEISTTREALETGGVEFNGMQQAKIAEFIAARQAATQTEIRTTGDQFDTRIGQTQKRYNQQIREIEQRLNSQIQTIRQRHNSQIQTIRQHLDSQMRSHQSRIDGIERAIAEYPSVCAAIPKLEHEAEKTGISGAEYQRVTDLVEEKLRTVAQAKAHYDSANENYESELRRYQAHLNIYEKLTPEEKALNPRPRAPRKPDTKAEIDFYPADLKPFCTVTPGLFVTSFSFDKSTAITTLAQRICDQRLASTTRSLQEKRKRKIELERQGCDNPEQQKALIATIRAKIAPLKKQRTEEEAAIATDRDKQVRAIATDRDARKKAIEKERDPAVQEVRDERARTIAELQRRKQEEGKTTEADLQRATAALTASCDDVNTSWWHGITSGGLCSLVAGAGIAAWMMNK